MRKDRSKLGVSDLILWMRKRNTSQRSGKKRNENAILYDETAHLLRVYGRLQSEIAGTYCCSRLGKPSEQLACLLLSVTNIGLWMLLIPLNSRI